MTDTKEQERKQFLDALYREMDWKLRRFARKKLQNEHQVEDAVQDTMVVACERWEKVMAHPKPQAWLIEVMRRVLYETLRQLAKEAQTQTSSFDEFSGVHYDDYYRIEYLDLLDPEDFEVIEKTVVHRYTAREAAQELGISEEACKKRKQRATKRLQKNYFGK